VSSSLRARICSPRASRSSSFAFFRLREHLVFLFLHMVHDIFAQHREGGDVVGVVRLHVLELLDQHLGGLVLDRRLVHDVLVLDRPRAAPGRKSPLPGWYAPAGPGKTLVTSSRQASVSARSILSNSLKAFLTFSWSAFRRSIAFAVLLLDFGIGFLSSEERTACNCCTYQRTSRGLPCAISR